jgi:hypothetical protein
MTRLRHENLLNYLAEIVTYTSGDVMRSGQLRGSKKS